MGKIRNLFRKKLDYNHDGKVNFKDLMKKIKDSIDVDKNGHVDIDEFANAVEKTVEVVKTVKEGV